MSRVLQVTTTTKKISKVNIFLCFVSEVGRNNASVARHAFGRLSSKCRWPESLSRKTLKHQSSALCVDTSDLTKHVGVCPLLKSCQENGDPGPSPIWVPCPPANHHLFQSCPAGAPPHPQSVLSQQAVSIKSGPYPTAIPPIALSIKSPYSQWGVGYNGVCTCHVHFTVCKSCPN